MFIFFLTFQRKLFNYNIYIYLWHIIYMPFIHHSIIYLYKKYVHELQFCFFNCALEIQLKKFCLDAWQSLIVYYLSKEFISNFENNWNKTKFHWNVVPWFTFPWKTHISYQNKNGLNINYIFPLHSYVFKCRKFCCLKQ